MYNLDQQTDYSGKQLYSYLTGKELPEYVKTAEIDDTDTLAGLPKEAFADPARRIYPLNNAPRVFVSNAYFLDKKAALEKMYGKGYTDKLAENIKIAADILGITEDLELYEANQRVKVASDYNQAHLCNFTVGDQVVELYPVKTAADLTKSAEHFNTNIRNFPFDVRVQTAKNIVKAARELAVDEVPDLIMKYAGMYYPDLENLGQEIWRRSTKLKQAEHVEFYNKLQEDISNISDMDEVMKVAEVLYHVENMENLFDQPKIAAILGDPVDRIFTLGIEKIASAMQYIEMHGNKYDYAALSKVAKDKYEEAFGMELDPNDFYKLADVLPTMPRSDVRLFEEISGVKPM